MKKGQRRKENKRANRKRVAGHHKGKGRKNPAFPALLNDATARHMVNMAIGASLIQMLDIDFVGLIEKRADESEPEAPETIQ